MARILKYSWMNFLCNIKNTTWPTINKKETSIHVAAIHENLHQLIYIFQLYCSRLKSELQMLRKRGALKATSATDDRGIGSGGGGGGRSVGGRSALGGGTDRCCVRCRMALGRIMNRGALCKCCRQRVCKACREYNVKATDWVCTVCYKNA